jgi:hypothetical protein
MGCVDPADLANEPVDDLFDDTARRDRNGAGSLREVESEVGDEEVLSDGYYMDDRGTRSLGTQLDDEPEPEPGLD